MYCLCYNFSVLVVIVAVREKRIFLRVVVATPIGLQYFARNSVFPGPLSPLKQKRQPGVLRCVGGRCGRSGHPYVSVYVTESISFEVGVQRWGLSCLDRRIVVYNGNILPRIEITGRAFDDLLGTIPASEIGKTPHHPAKALDHLYRLVGAPPALLSVR